MNKELLKEIDDDLEKMRQESEPFFTELEATILLKLLDRYSEEQGGANTINLIDELVLLISDSKDLVGLSKESTFMYVVNFIRNKLNEQRDEKGVIK